MLKEIFERNKGSTENLMNPLGLAKASFKRPKVISNSDPGRIRKDKKNERLNCRQQWNKFVNWFVETLLSYVRVVLLLCFAYGLLKAKQIFADTPEVQSTLSILTSFTLFWLSLEYLEAHTGLPIKEYIKRFLDRFR